MEAVNAYYDGTAFVPLEPIKAKKNQRAIITILDFDEESSTLSEQKTVDSSKSKIKLGFLKDKVPPLPDSFFDPLPEEELQAWEL